MQCSAFLLDLSHSNPYHILSGIIVHLPKLDFHRKLCNFILCYWRPKFKIWRSFWCLLLFYHHLQTIYPTDSSFEIFSPGILPSGSSTSVPALHHHCNDLSKVPLSSGELFLKSFHWVFTVYRKIQIPSPGTCSLHNPTWGSRLISALLLQEPSDPITLILLKAVDPLRLTYLYSLP